MNFDDLASLFENRRNQYGKDAYKHITAILTEAKQLHYRDWQRSPTAMRDHEQSWRAFKGKNFEKLVAYIIRREVEELGLGMIQGNVLERSNPNNLPGELNKVARNLLVRFPLSDGPVFCLPDVDIVIYDPARDCSIVAVVSSKITLRERIAQTGYWKLKLLGDKTTRHIRVFFVTPDEDGTLSVRTPPKKGRAIVEVDTDGAYVLTEREVQVNSRVKYFDEFLKDVSQLAGH